jgi:hypothetical protein
VLYTVTKANQNEALLWKIAILGMEKPPLLVPEHFFPCLCGGILHSSMPTGGFSIPEVQFSRGELNFD